MAKEINLEDNEQSYTNKRSNILYRDQLEYTGSKIFWTTALILGAATIYVSVAYLLFKQLKKD